MAELAVDLSKLLAECKVPEAFGKWLAQLSPPVTSVEAFATLAGSKSDVPQIAKQAGVKEGEASVIGAIRQAWIIADAAVQRSTDIRAGKLVEDVDAPLPDGGRQNLEAFAKHYNVVLPAYRLGTPGLLGRAVREAAARTHTMLALTSYRSQVDPAAPGKMLKIPLGTTQSPSLASAMDIEINSKLTMVRAVRCYSTQLAIAGLPSGWCTLSEADCLWEFVEEKAFSRPSKGQQPSLAQLIECYNITMAEIVSQFNSHKKRLGEAIQVAIDKTARHWESAGATQSNQEPPAGSSGQQETDKFKELKQLVVLLQPKAQSQRPPPPETKQPRQSPASSGQKRSHDGQGSKKNKRYWGRGC